MKHPDKQRIIFFSVISQGGRKKTTHAAIMAVVFL